MISLAKTRYTVRIRQDLAEVRECVKQVDGKSFDFSPGWVMDEEDTSIYIGETAMLPRDPDYPLEAPGWIASGDLVEVKAPG